MISPPSPVVYAEATEAAKGKRTEHAEQAAKRDTSHQRPGQQAQGRLE